MSKQTDRHGSKITRLMPTLWGIVFGLVCSIHTSARAQDPLKLLPDNYKLIFDNKDVAVIRAHYRPHEKIRVHDHTSYSTVFVYLSDSGPVRIDHQEPGEPPSSVTRPPTVKGSYRVAPGIKERHSIENLGDSSSDFLRVELKNVQLQMQAPYRGKAPANLDSIMDTVEFSNPALDIERIICTGHPPCALQASPSPSLIVAFTPLTVASTDSEVDHKIEAGTVYWLPASHTATVAPIPGSPAHMLRILLPSAASSR